MAHSNFNPYFNPYPLPFPNEQHRFVMSSYSSLAGALGTDAGYAGRQERKPTATDCDAVVDKQAIYLDRPPVSNPSYPYPARNVFNPGTYPASTSSSVSDGRLPNNNTDIAWAEISDRKDLFRLPHWYERLPQPLFVEPDNHQEYQAGAKLFAIHFLRRGDRPPYSLWDLLNMTTMPDLANGDLPVLRQSSERWIKVRLIWPGYSHYPFEKRIYVKGSAAMTANLLLTKLANDIHEFARLIHNEAVVVERGQERWAVMALTESAPLWQNCVITSLRHVTGSIWQPEIYCPKGGHVTVS